VCVSDAVLPQAQTFKGGPDVPHHQRAVSPLGDIQGAEDKHASVVELVRWQFQWRLLHQYEQAI
jgi:hypothetical protein